MRPNSVFTVGKGVFVRLDDSAAVDDPVLYPATVTRANEGGLVLEVDESIGSVAAGSTMCVLYEDDMSFFQQDARIDALLDEPAADDTIRIGLTPTNEPREADGRAFQRIRTVECGLLAEFSDFPNCPLVDISPTGFSIVAPPGAAEGDVVKVRLQDDGEVFEGAAVVQSVRKLNEDNIRYGMRSLSRKHGGGDLIRGQQQITMSVRRQQFAMKSA